MRDYFFGRFPSQLGLLAFRRPDSVVLEHIMCDPSVVFFGGPDWENVANDLRQVPENDRPQFVLCLFMVVLTDQALYTYFRDSYDGWRRRTNFPKFGWSGFGPHNENPFKLLRASERNQVVSADSILNLIPRFVRFFVDETSEYFQQHLPAVDVRGYYRAIRGDMGYAFNQGVVVPRFKAEIEALTSGN